MDNSLSPVGLHSLESKIPIGFQTLAIGLFFAIIRHSFKVIPNARFELPAQSFDKSSCRPSQTLHFHNKNS